MSFIPKQIKAVIRHSFKIEGQIFSIEKLQIPEGQTSISNTENQTIKL